MTTDKERAEVMRELAAELSEPTAPWVAESHWNSSALMHKADELDPPKPTYADGTVAWVTDSMGDRWISVRANGGWQNRTNAEYGGYTGVVKVEPLRVLAADEIAIQRTEDTSVECLDTTIDDLSDCNWPHPSHAIARNILRDIRRAVLEAGDAK